jgi:hypothetical protein
LPNRPVAPFRMKGVKSRPFSAEERAFAEEKISKRLARGTWVELSAAETAGARCMSNEFTTSDWNGKPRSIADLKFLYRIGICV